MNNRDKLKRHLKRKFFKDDKKVIKIYIESEDDLYNSLDSSKETLSDEVVNYLDRTTETLLPLSSVTIMIDSKDDVNLKHFERCLKIHYGIEKLNYTRIDKKILRKKIFLLSVSLITFLSFILFKNIIDEVRSFVLTLAVWEFVDMLIYEDEEEEIKRYVADILAKAEVESNIISK